MRIPTPPALQQQVAERTVARVVDFYRSLGVTPAEGAEPIRVELTGEHVASYQGPSLLIGKDHRDGAWYGDCDEVIAHEMGHRVMDRLGLLPKDFFASENAAVQEHVADVFTAAFDQDDWTIGEDLPSGAMRDMAHPGRFGDPSTYAQAAIEVSRENGPYSVDWHGIAGVPNRAASMLGERLGRTELAKLYVQTLRTNARRGDDLRAFAAAVTTTARDRYGNGSSQLRATEDAFRAVGLLS